MAKKRSWFSLLKRVFLFETHPKTEKKERKRRWLFGRLRTKSLASITAPPKDRTLSGTEETQGKNTDAVIEIAAAADAVQLNVSHKSTHSCDEATQESMAPVHEESLLPQHQNGRNIEDLAIRIQTENERNIEELAAIKIQTAFRAYLAKKALRALKGIVKLQAIIRGHAVRRQAMTTLKCLQSIVNIQSKICARRSLMAEGTWQYDENKQLQTLKDKIIKVDANSQRRWDDSLLTREEADAMVLRQKEAAIKRERIKEYSFVHRRSTETEQNKGNGKWKYWLDQWVDTQVAKSKELEELEKPSEEFREKQLKVKAPQRQYHTEGQNSPMLIPRRSFHHRRQSSAGHDDSYPISPVVPTYMAATASVKAKARSMSSPKLRPGSFDTQSESFSPHKNKLCLVSSIKTEVHSNCRIGRSNTYQQRSPSLKGLPGPVKSSRTLKDLSINSELALPNWDRQSTFR